MRIYAIAAVMIAMAGCHTAERQDVADAPAQSRTLPPQVRVAPAMPLIVREVPLPSPRAAEVLPADVGAFRKCSACHTLTNGVHGIGPSLKGVYGQPAAQASGYRYSNALRTADLVWDAATLDTFLTRPSDHVPGNKMSFAGLKDPGQRAQIIALMERYAD